MLTESVFVHQGLSACSILGSVGGGLETSIQYKGQHARLHVRSDPFVQPLFRKGLRAPGEEDSNIADALRENSIPAGSCEFKLLLAALNASIHQISKQRYLRQSPVANRAPHSDETLSSGDPADEYDSDEIRSIAVASGEGHVALKKSTC